MAVFVYKARQSDGSIVSGKIEAESLNRALSFLRNQGLRVLSATEQKGVVLKGLVDTMNIFNRVGLGDRVVFSRQLSTLINAGIPVVQCLNILIEQIKKTMFKKVLIGVRSDIEGGEFISSAMAKHPSVFDRLYISMVKSGEIGGVLDE
ncbi:TPA: pilus assembly protein PilC, partial [bacterium]|nr:pilus assembly protein PilC [bacterium]